MLKPESILIVLFISIMSTFCFSQNEDFTEEMQTIKEYNKALIWRGFEHKWTYNHRLNRLGNYVIMEDHPYSVHTSASGLGSDSTFAKSHYSYIESPNLVFKEVSVKLLLNGQEGDLLTKTQESVFDLESWEQNLDGYSVLLNGFEIKSLRKADQLQMMRFYVEDPIYSEETQQVQITSHFNLVTNCRTIECPVLNNKTMYELTLYILVLGYKEGEANFYNGYSTRNYEWDTQLEVSESSQSITLNGQPERFKHAFVGIRGIGVVS